MLNILNNVVNRIIISADENFTYQDEVYISSVLRKIGITDTAFFMQQVSELRSDNLNIYNLLKLYSENIAKLAPALKPESPEPEKPQTELKTEEISAPPAPRYTLHNEIYKRLQTAEIYNIIHNYSSTAYSDNYISSAQLHTAEQLRVSNQLALSELKQQFFGLHTAELQHMHINRYETGENLPPPQTEREVIKLGAAGVLLNIIDNAMTARITQLSRNEPLWLNITNAIYGAAQHSLARFQTFHTRRSFYSSSDITVENKLRELSKKEEALLLKISSRLPEIPAAEIKLIENQTETTELHSEAVSQATSHTDKTVIESTVESKLKEKTEKENALLLKTQQMLGSPQKPAEIKLPPAPAEAEKPAGEILGENTHTVNERIREELTEQIHAVNRERAEAAAGMPASEIAATGIIQNQFKILNQAAEADLSRHISIINQHVSEVDSFDISGTEQDGIKAVITEHLMQDYANSIQPAESGGQDEPQTSGSPASKAQSGESGRSKEKQAASESVVLKALSQITNEQDLSLQISNINQHISNIDSTVISGAQQEQSQLAATVEHILQDTRFPAEAAYGDEEMPKPEASQSLKQQLDEIDRRNKEKAEELAEKIKNFVGSEKPKPDSSKIIIDSLKALENPAQVFSEIFSNEAEFKHPDALLPEEELALSVADEATRMIYETLIKQQQNPNISAAVQDAGAKIQAFNADIQEIEKFRQTEITHHTEKLREETETIFNNTDTVIEQYRARQQAEPYKASGVFRTPAQTIHKLPEAQVTPEELIEQLQHSKTETRQETINTRVSINQSLTETEINSLIKEQTTKSTEDITALVNNTIAKQLGTISDRVYNNMERRLSLERARRGK
jgi:hypothetical protein